MQTLAAVKRNIWKARHIWGQLEKLQRWEGEDPIILETFYRKVVQAVIIFGAKTWVLTSFMDKRLEGVHTGFLRQMTSNRARHQRDR